MKNLLKEIAKINNSVDLNVVIEAIKLQRKTINNAKIAKAKAAFSVGDSVIVNGSKTKGDVGIITKMKIKRAIVRCKNTQGENVLWDCPLSILEAV